MSKIITAASICLTLIAGCSQTIQTAGNGVSFGSAHGDTPAKIWLPRRHSEGGRG